MRQMNVDTVFRVRLSYQPGQLAKVAKAIGDAQGLVGELHIVRLGEDYTIRDIVVETKDDEHTKLVEAQIRALEGVELISLTDAVFAHHQGGKIHSGRRVPLNNVSDLRMVYTPGVARVSTAIATHPASAYEYTTLGNSVGIFTNGTRVLGLGDIGPVASLPVMEGKAVLYDAFVGVSATPILLSTKDAQTFIETVVQVSPSFGGIHLEDIRSPDCYHIEEELIKRLNKPVMHDDQHGTAVVALAAVINAAKCANLPLSQATVGQIGLGAAGSAIARLIMAYGVKTMKVADRSPVALDWMAGFGAQKASQEEILRSCDVVIAATGQPGLIDPKQVRKGQILFALSNPRPEIEPRAALAAGAAFASDGKSINNALAFPGIFKAALLARTKCISDEMKIAAAQAIASMAEPGEIVPDPLDLRVHEAVVKAVLDAVDKQGLRNTASL